MTDPSAPLTQPVSFLLVPGLEEDGFFQPNSGVAVLLDLDREAARGIADRMADLEAVATRWEGVARLEDGPEQAPIRGVLRKHFRGEADYEVWLEQAVDLALDGEAVSISPDLAADDMWEQVEDSILFRRFVRPDDAYWTYLLLGAGQREQLVPSLRRGQALEAWLAQAQGAEAREAFRRLSSVAPQLALRVLEHGAGPEIGDARRRDVSGLLAPEDLVGLQQSDDHQVRQEGIAWQARIGAGGAGGRSR